MKYAAKRTWPDKPKSWEAKGEAETPEAFALEFAADQGLGLGTEMVVIEREGEDAEIQFFKIANTSPYQLVEAEPRAGAGGASRQDAMPEPSSTAPSVAAYGSAEVAATPLDNLRPFRTMILYMLKVALVAFAAIYAFGYLFRYLRSVL